MSQEEMFSDILNGEKELDENEYDSMMQEWMKDGDQMQKMESMMAEWGKSWDQQMNMQNIPIDQPTLQF